MGTKEVLLNKQTYLPINKVASLLGKRVKIKSGEVVYHRSGQQVVDSDIPDLIYYHPIKEGTVTQVSLSNEISFGKGGEYGDMGGDPRSFIDWFDISKANIEIGGVIKSLLSHLYQAFSAITFRKKVVEC